MPALWFWRPLLRPLGRFPRVYASISFSFCRIIYHPAGIYLFKAITSVSRRLRLLLALGNLSVPFRMRQPFLAAWRALGFESMAASQLFAPYRALGFVSSHVPAVLHSAGADSFITTAIGRTFHYYNVIRSIYPIFSSHFAFSVRN